MKKVLCRRCGKVINGRDPIFWSAWKEARDSGYCWNCWNKLDFKDQSAVIQKLIIKE